MGAGWFLAHGVDCVLKANSHRLDLSSRQLDESQTLCKKQGKDIGYQARKAGRTTNALFLSDKAGQPLSLWTPQAGNHHGLYEIDALFAGRCVL